MTMMSFWVPNKCDYLHVSIVPGHYCATGEWHSAAVTLACRKTWAGSEYWMEQCGKYVYTVTLVTVAEGAVVLTAGVGALRCPPWNSQWSGSPRRTGSGSQTWRVGMAGRPAHSEENWASQRCPGTRWTAPPPLSHVRLCPSCRLWSASSSPGGGGGPVWAGCQRCDPGAVLKRRTGAGAGKGSWRTCWLWRRGERRWGGPGSASSCGTLRTMRNWFWRSH